MDELSRTREANRSRILNAATELFIEKGYSRTPVSLIAKRAGVDRKTFYNYFSGKEQIIEAVSRDERLRLISNEDYLSRDGTGFELLEQYFYDFLSNAVRQKEIIVLTSRFEEANPDFHIFLGTTNEESLKKHQLYRIVERGVHDGSINPGGMETTELLFCIFMPLFSGLQKFFSRERILEENFHVNRKLFSSYIDLMLSGLKGQET